MPAVEHVEHHFTATAAVRDIVIGMSDGLTVPFALAAGLTSAATALMRGTGIIVTAGFAEIAAGSIAMGLGGYLAAKTDSEHYASELDREYRETVELPDVETEEVAKVFRSYGLTPAQLEPIVAAITSDQKRWVDFMMRFELGLEAPDPSRAARSAGTIALSYIVGGLIPLAPYIVINQIRTALYISDWRHASGSPLLRLDQRALHRSETVARRIPNSSGGRPRGCCRFLYCPALQLAFREPLSHPFSAAVNSARIVRP